MGRCARPTRLVTDARHGAGTKQSARGKQGSDNYYVYEFERVLATCWDGHVGASGHEPGEGHRAKHTVNNYYCVWDNQTGRTKTDECAISP